MVRRQFIRWSPFLLAGLGLVLASWGMYQAAVRQELFSTGVVLAITLGGIVAVQSILYGIDPRPRHQLRRLHTKLRRASRRRIKTEQLLRQYQQEHLQIEYAINAAQAGLIISDPRLPDNRVVYVNEGFCALSGYGEEEILGRPFPFTTDRRLGPNELEPITRAIADRLPVRQVLQCVRRNGTPYCVELTLNPVFDGRGNLIAFAGLVIDMTERVLAEREREAKVDRLAAAAQESQRQKQLLHAVVDSMGFGIMAIGRDGQVLALNPAAIRLCNLRQPEGPVFTVADLQGLGESKLCYSDSMEPVLPEDWPIVRALRGEIFDKEELCVRPSDSSEPMYHWGMTRPIYDESGEMWGSVAAFQDISELKRAQHLLETREERLREIFDNTKTGIFSASAAGCILECNAAFARCLGYESVEEARGNSLADACGSSYLEHLTRSLKQQTNLIDEDIEIVVRGEKRFAFIQNILGKFDSQGNLVEIRGFWFDVTERKQLEEKLRQSQKLEAIGRLAGGIAHDFNNMLTIICGYSEMALEEVDLDPRFRMMMEQIKKAADRSVSFTNQLLAFTRKQVLQPRVLDLALLLKGMEPLVARMVGADIHLTMDAEPGLGFVKIDPIQMQQVVFNLIVNSRDAMPQGGRLTLKASSCQVEEGRVGLTPGDYVELLVSDSGTGIPSEVCTQIFEPFFTTKEQGKGTGLGLSTAYGIITQSRGDIAVESVVGLGTTFRILLPVVDEPLEESARTTSVVSERDGTETILLAEDEEEVRNYTATLLRNRGYNVVEAVSGLDGIMKFLDADANIDLLLTDVVMPELGGQQLAMRVRKLNANVKVIYMSAYTDSAILEFDADDNTAFMQKPFAASELLHLVRRVLDGQGEHIDADEPIPTSVPCDG